MPRKHVARLSVISLWLMAADRDLHISHRPRMGYDPDYKERRSFSLCTEYDRVLKNIHKRNRQHLGLSFLQFIHFPEKEDTISQMLKKNVAAFVSHTSRCLLFSITLYCTFWRNPFGLSVLKLVAVENFLSVIWVKFNLISFVKSSVVFYYVICLAYVP